MDVFKRDVKGNPLQNLYFSTYGFFIIVGWSDFMYKKDESSTVVNTGQTDPLSVPSTVGILKQMYIYIGRGYNIRIYVYELLIIC
jgi:hypothetical protein